MFYSITTLASNALASAPGGAGGENSMTRSLMFFGIVLVFFYLILWRPEQKRRKKMNSQRSSLKSGDRVTAMGIIGEVVEVNENHTLILKMYDGSKIEVLKNAISQVHVAQEEKATETAAQATSK